MKTEKKIEIEDKCIKDHMEYEFPKIMDEKPELLGGIVNDFYDGVPSINGLSIMDLNGMKPDIYPYEELMWYVQDRLNEEMN